MMIVISIFFSFFILLYVSLWRNPKHKIDRYKRSFEELGYKVYVDSYSPFKISSIAKIIKGVHDKQNALYYLKKELVGYDLLVGNQINKPFIWLFNPNLIQEFCEKER